MLRDGSLVAHMPSLSTCSGSLCICANPPERLCESRCDRSQHGLSAFVHYVYWFHPIYWSSGQDVLKKDHCPLSGFSLVNSVNENTTDMKHQLPVPVSINILVIHHRRRILDLVHPFVEPPYSRNVQTVERNILSCKCPPPSRRPPPRPPRLPPCPRRPRPSRCLGGSGAQRSCRR